MHDSLRNGTITAVGFAVLAIIAALAFWSWVIWDSSRQYTEGQQAAHYYSAAENERAKASIEATCVTKPTPSAIAKCVQEEIEASRSYKRSERDLSAQESMAYWALGMFLASLATMAVTGAGVWLVYRTLEATRDALNEARKATIAAEQAVEVTRQSAERQLRAYVDVRPPSITELEPGEPIKVTFSIRNTGQTPAHQIWNKIQFVVGDPNTFKLPDEILGPPFGQAIFAGSAMGTTCTVPTLADHLFANVGAGRAALITFGFVKYVDMFGAVRTTHFAFYINGDEFTVTGKFNYLSRGNFAN